jgi:dTDP-4-dehydrorhamnose reductase
MRILIIGANGQLGTDLCKTFSKFEVIPCTHNDIEITDQSSIRSSLTKYRPEVVINTAAYVRVDDCELDIDKAFRVNALGVRNVAVACQDIGAKLIHFSTDYVFGGETKGLEKTYTEFDIPVPYNVYGKSKLAGEILACHLCHRHFIVRTSGLFGTTISRGKNGNFVETIIRLAKHESEIKVVNDQVFSPTYTKDLSQKINQIIDSEYYGIFHITNRGSCSWYELAKQIKEFMAFSASIIPITSEQYGQKAKRPDYSVLDNYHLRLLGIDDMRPWQEALKDYLKEKEYLT